MSTTVCVVGTIATDPRTITSAGRATFSTFRLASTERRYDRDRAQWLDGDTNWFTINSFRGLAEHAGESFMKGDRVIVHGRLRIRAWENEGKSGTAVEIEADSFGHDLRWGTSSFTKDASRAAEPVDAGSVDTESAGSEPSEPELHGTESDQADDAEDTDDEQLGAGNHDLAGIKFSSGALLPSAA